jgi:hypothetical protein
VPRAVVVELVGAVLVYTAFPSVKVMTAKAWLPKLTAAALARIRTLF